jgi:hypothetical protein
MTITKDELREEFGMSEFLHWKNSQGEPEIEYVLWLEEKIIKMDDKINQLMLLV